MNTGQHPDHLRLTRLCLRLTRDPDAAEDLAQETLVEALRHAHKFRGGDRWPWLAAIARHVCRRWARTKSRELARRSRRPTRFENDPTPEHEPQPADPTDLELDLERAELTELLDRALALLPPPTRHALLARYVRDSSLAETADRLGLSTGAVAMRLHRGKLALHRVLHNELGQDAVASGILLPEPTGWQPTSLWCLVCGRNLYRRAFHRLIGQATAYYRAAHASGIARCMECGRPTRLHLGDPPWGNVLPLADTMLFTICRACGGTTDFRLSGLVLATPEAQRFWRAHPRMRFLREREVEAEGRPALVTTFASTTGAARLEAVTDRATLRLLSIHGAPP